MTIDELTITFTDKDGRLSADTLRKALEQTLEYLRRIEEATVAADIEVRWNVVRVRMSSPLRMTFAPEARKSGKTSRPTQRRLVKNAMQGVAGIERGHNVPRYVDDIAINATKQLFVVATKDKSVVSFESPQFTGKVTLTEDFAKNADELTEKARLYVDYSTIEGRLETVSVHDGNTVVIWETLTNNRVECVVSREQVTQAAELLGKRVAVTGRVHHRNHVPTRIHVEEPFRVLRETRNLPQPQDIGPIDITDGLSSEEHVRRMRNA